jgi:hypothetical protein
MKYFWHSPRHAISRHQTDCEMTTTKPTRHRRPETTESRRAARHKFLANFLARHGVSYAADRWRRSHPAEQIKRFDATKGAMRVKMGRHYYWKAHLNIPGSRQRQKNFSIDKLGETGARLAAALQRMCWLIEYGAWRPADGDPFAILGYTQLLRGNGDYEHAQIDDAHSTWMPERSMISRQ